MCFFSTPLLSRHVSDPEMFHAVIQCAIDPRYWSHHYIGGNAALMAQKIAINFPQTTVSFTKLNYLTIMNLLIF